METIPILLAGIFLYLLYRLSTKNFDYWKKKNIPFMKPTPVVGNFLDAFIFKESIGGILLDMYNKMTEHDFFGIFVFNKPHLVVKTPALIKQILVKDFQYFHDRTIASDPKSDLMASSVLFLLRNPDWKIIRSKMTPAFTTGKIKGMIPLMNDVGENMTNFLTKKIMENNKSIEAKEMCAKYATDVITSCAFGVEAKCFEDEDAPFRTVGREMFGFTLANGIRGITYFFLQELVPLFGIHFIPTRVSEFLSKTFWATIENREKQNFKRNDVIDLIVKLKQEGNIGVDFEGDKIVAQAVQYFLAGFETTSSTISFTLYELCLNRNIQHRLRQEIRTVVNNHKGEISYECIKDMKYLHKVVSETLRKYPVLPFLDRMCNTTYKLPGTNVTIEKNTPVYIPMFGLHYDPKYWSEPQKFDPERFNEDQIKTRPEHAYIPFGSGPHNCIGERFGLIGTKIGLIHLLSQFEVEASDDTPIPIRYEAKSFVLASKDGLPMKFVDTGRRVSVAA